MTTKDKIYVSKSVTVGLDENTLKGLTDAAKAVGAPTDVRVSMGGGVPKDAEATEHSLYSVTFTWNEEV